jgi:hypothetical protein
VSDDVATDKAGTAFVGWISDDGSGREVHLCTIPAGQVACSGGVQVISALDSSSAEGLRVLATAAGDVTLVWFHDTTNSVNGPQGAEIATATSVNGGPLNAATDVASAPSFGSLADVELGPGGAIWTVALTSDEKTLQIRPGITSGYVSKAAPYAVSTAKLAFSGSTGIVAIQQGSYVTHPVRYAYEKTGSWSGFKTLAKTWTAGANLGLTGTTSGARLIASVNNADYYPVVSRWTGTSFSKPAITGDTNNCSAFSHDPTSDASGRMADVSEECERVAVANLPDTRHAAIVRFGAGGTFAAGIPQIATTPRGRAWVVWSVLSGVKDKLLLAPVLLPGRDVSVHKSAGGDKVTVTGPQSCLPAVSIAVRVSGSGARVVSKSLRLAGKKIGATLNGAALTAGHTYKLTGKVTFSGGRTLTKSLTFRSCPN